MFGVLVGAAWRLLKLWFLVVGLIAFMSGPYECFVVTTDVIRKLCKLMFVLGPKHAYYQTFGFFVGVEL